MNHQDMLSTLVADRKYDRAKEHCKEQIITGSNLLFWKTQLGYLYFLDIQNDSDGFYLETTRIFEELTSTYPDDLNSLFWLGYTNLIVLSEYDKSRKALSDALKISTTHPYCNLVLAELVEIETAVILLRTVLEVQPYNFRALKSLMERLATKGEIGAACNIANILVYNPPFYETNFGIMNEYVNAVFNNIHLVESIRNEARKLIGSRI